MKWLGGENIIQSLLSYPLYFMIPFVLYSVLLSSIKICATVLLNIYKTLETEKKSCVSQAEVSDAYRTVYEVGKVLFPQNSIPNSEN